MDRDETQAAITLVCTAILMAGFAAIVLAFMLGIAWRILDWLAP